MKKTVKEWFDDLPSPIREMAVENAEKRGVLMEKHECLTLAINSFFWDGTKQGHSFWSLVCCGMYEKALMLFKQKVAKEVQSEIKELTGCISNVLIADESATITFVTVDGKLPKHIPHRHKFSPIKFN